RHRRRRGKVPIYSTVTGETSDGSDLNAMYWAANLRSPVLFSGAMQSLLKEGHDIFLEMSPHPILVTAISDAIQEQRGEGVAIGTLKREQNEQIALAEAVGNLYVYGYPLSWERICEPGRYTELPSYPWQRERFWRSQGESLADDRGVSVDRRMPERPILGKHLRSSLEPGTHFWEQQIETRTCGVLAEHRVEGTPVVPAAAFLEMMMEAAEEVFGPASHLIETISFRTMLTIPDGIPQLVQVVLTAEREAGTLQISSIEEPQAPTAKAKWIQHATARVLTGNASSTSGAPSHDLIEVIKDRCGERVSGLSLYEALSRHGLAYGESFRSVEEIWKGAGEALGRIVPPTRVQTECINYRVHPAILDAAFQVLGIAGPIDVNGSDEGPMYIPAAAERIKVYLPANGRLWGHARLRDDGLAPDTLVGDVWLLDETRGVVAEAQGLKLQRVDRGVARRAADWLYEPVWERKPLRHRDEPWPADREKRYWLIFADKRGVAQGLRSLLEEQGDGCLMIWAGNRGKSQPLPDGHFVEPNNARAIAELIRGLAGNKRIVSALHLWSLDAVGGGLESTRDEVEQALELGTISALFVVQGLANAGMEAPPKLSLVTRGAQWVAKEEGKIAVGQSPLWGLGRTVAYEHPKLRCRLIDVIGANELDEAAVLYREVCNISEEAEREVAWRG
ncbi:MAG: polyketide synthase dehydratase domain-containing protein, partial [Blastocatellia bacterium]